MNAPQGQAVGLARPAGLKQPVTLEFSQIVAELVQAIGGIGDLERGQDGLVDLPSRPAADVGASMLENLEQADDTGVVDFDAGIADRPNGNWQGDALQERKVHVDIEPLSLEARKPVDNRLELVTDLAKAAIRGDYRALHVSLRSAGILPFRRLIFAR